MIFNSTSIFNAIALLLALSFQFVYAIKIVNKSIEPSVSGWVVFVLSIGSLVFSSQAIGSTMVMPMLIFVCNAVILCLAVVYGKYHWGWFDKIAILSVILSLLLWWQTQNPWISFICAISVDITGYILFSVSVLQNRTKESIGVWLISVFSFFFAIFSINKISQNDLLFVVVNLVGSVLICVSEYIRQRTHEKRIK